MAIIIKNHFLAAVEGHLFSSSVFQSCAQSHPLPSWSIYNVMRPKREGLKVAVRSAATILWLFWSNVRLFFCPSVMAKETKCIKFRKKFDNKILRMQLLTGANTYNRTQTVCIQDRKKQYCNFNCIVCTIESFYVPLYI